MILTEADKNFIKNNLSDSEQLLLATDVNDVLDAIFDWIAVNGFEPPDYYDYNNAGREAQKVYDRIFRNN